MIRRILSSFKTRKSRNGVLRRTVCLSVIAISLLSGCRGNPSESPPVHLNPNMDYQPKYKPQARSEFFADHSTMRTRVPGTVAMGELREDSAYFTGRDENGNLVNKSPVPVTTQLLKRGRERFDIYCSPCHSRVGDGRGIMLQRGYIPPANFHDGRMQTLPDGHIFDVITNGIRNMPSYRYQIPAADRWAIVSYTRALLRSRNAVIDDIPEELRNSIK